MLEKQPETHDLVELLDVYETHLNTLASANVPNVETVFCTLTTRDRINSIVRGDTQLDPALFVRLFSLDNRLKQCADALNDYDLLEKCRLSYRAPLSAWWWYLSPKNSTLMRSNRFGWVWGAATITCLLVSGTFMAQTARAFSSQGFDFLGTLSTIAQGAGFALVASGAATQKGHDTLEMILKSLKVPGHRTAEATFGLSVGLLVVSYGVHTNLYRLGDYYHRQGEDYAADQQWNKALSSYQRALQFNSNPQSLLDEGQIYETLGDYEAAIDAYSYGAAGDPYFLTASARASLLRELNTSGWKGGVPQEQLNQTLATLERARLHPRAGQDPDLLRQIYLNLGFVELARLNFDRVQDTDKAFLARAQVQFEQAFNWELQQTYPEGYVFRWKDLRAQCYQATSRLVNVVLDVPTTDEAFVYLQGLDPRITHADVWYSCHEIFVEEGDLEVATDVLLLQTILSSKTIAPYWTSQTQGFPQATIADINQLDRLAEQLESTIKVDVKDLDFGDYESLIIRLAVDDQGHIIDYYTYDPWALGVTRNTMIYSLWQQHAPIIEQRAAEASFGVADFQLEILPDGSRTVTPWGRVYDVDTIALGINERPIKISLARREVLKGLLAAQLRSAYPNVQEPAPKFDRKLVYRVTVRADGRVSGYEPAESLEREQLNKTPLPYLNAEPRPSLASVDFLVQFKSSYAFQISDPPVE
jgi:tetratricopeptide (TPR) repeat protein